MIEELFVPSELALRLKKLGFDELCIARSYGGGIEMLSVGDPLKNSEIKEAWFSTIPLWQQAFDWLLIKLPDYNFDQMENTFDLRVYENKEWAHLAFMSTRADCLEKLIKIKENDR